METRPVNDFKPVNAVQIEFTKTIDQIFAAYQGARPNGLEQSILVQNDFPEDNVKQKLLEKLGRNVGEGVVVAEIGALGGQAGVGLVAAYKTAEVLVGNLWAWVKPKTNERKTFYNLSYLKPKTYTIDSSRENDTVYMRRIKTLQKLRNYVYAYQQLKGTRFGLNLIVYQIGEKQLNENLIDDGKYLVEILYGRKLDAAYEALINSNDEKLFQKQITHLLDFEEKVSKLDEILESNSDDTARISMRTLSIEIIKDVTEMEEKNKEIQGKFKLLELLKTNYAKTSKAVADFEKSFQERFTRLLCNTEPNNFILYQDNESFKNLESKDEIKNNPYLNFLNQTIYAHNKVDPNQLENFSEELKTYTGNKKDPQKIITCFTSIIDSNNKLLDLQNALTKLMQIKGISALEFMKVIPQAIFIFKEIIKTQQELKAKLRQFSHELYETYPGCNKEFKNKFAKYGYYRIDFDTQSFHDALIILEQLADNADSITQNLEDTIKDQVKELDEQIKIYGYQPQIKDENKNDDIFKSAIGNVDEIASREIEEAKDDETNLEKSVQKGIEDNGEEFVKNLAPEIRELSFFEKIYNAAISHYNENAYKKQIKELIRKNKENKIQIQDLKLQNAELKIQNATQKKEHLELKIQNTTLEMEFNNTKEKNKKANLISKKPSKEEEPKLPMLYLYPVQDYLSVKTSLTHFHQTLTNLPKLVLKYDTEEVSAFLASAEKLLNEYINNENSKFSEDYVNKSLDNNQMKIRENHIFEEEELLLDVINIRSEYMKLRLRKIDEESFPFKKNNNSKENEKLLLKQAEQVFNNKGIPAIKSKDNLDNKNKYFSEAEAKKYLVKIKDGRLVDVDNKVLEDGQYIYIMDLDQNLYMYNNTGLKNPRTHSSFLDLKNVICAGGMSSIAGNISQINIASDKYSSSVFSLNKIVSAFNKEELLYQTVRIYPEADNINKSESLDLFQPNLKELEANHGLTLANVIKDINLYMKKRADETTESKFMAFFGYFSGQHYHERRADWCSILDDMTNENLDVGNIKAKITASIAKFSKHSIRQDYADKLTALRDVLTINPDALKIDYVKNYIHTSHDAYQALDYASSHASNYLENKKAKDKATSLKSARQHMFQYRRAVDGRSEFLSRNEASETESKNLYTSKFIKER